MFSPLFAAVYCSLFFTTLLLVGEVSKDTTWDRVKGLAIFAVLQPLVVFILLLGINQLATLVRGMVG